ncbi:bifunctional HAD superfamily/Dullard phosphatase domain [Babesia duncani]|uniref:Bifunctional HAD superfamily/Dullard phosphatase domain n=1 Tax=Babesia duncani TaxID=323732 RepID=A0AAD9PNY0_9APIC|nr:bifunctional HAD superfamily/Dullard phosphatase domain [Babesia duncani]
MPSIPVKVDNRMAYFVVSKRPHLDTFLMEMRKTYEIVIYTASCRSYAEAILRHTTIDHLIDRKLYRDDCIVNTEGEYVKDLKKVRLDTSKVILMDNSLVAGSIYPENFIPIESWFGGDSDTALLDIMPLLKALRYVPDVRLIIKLRLQDRHIPKSAKNTPQVKFQKEYKIMSDTSWNKMGERLNTKIKKVMDMSSNLSGEEG